MTTVTATTSTRFVTSADGTAIAYDVTGPDRPSSWSRARCASARWAPPSL